MPQLGVDENIDTVEYRDIMFCDTVSIFNEWFTSKDSRKWLILFCV